jgi:NAD(P)-dependent dehydrogenase (short-subunit alcohol dehydrogenase family)
MRDLTGRVAVITGGASGIGKGMAEAFAAAGMKLVLAEFKPAIRHRMENVLAERDPTPFRVV